MCDTVTKTSLFRWFVNTQRAQSGQLASRDGPANGNGSLRHNRWHCESRERYRCRAGQRDRGEYNGADNCVKGSELGDGEDVRG